MTQDEIIKMTRQAANAIPGYTEKVEDPSGAVLEFYNRFAKLVAQHEREACAVAAEKESLRGLPEEQPEGEELLRACAQIAGGVLIADAIRARGQA